MSKMTDEQRQDLQRLAQLPEAQIDTRDIPEVHDFPVSLEDGSTGRSRSR